MSDEDQLTMTDEELGLDPAEPTDNDDNAALEIKPEEGIEELKAKLLAEQKARAEAEARASQVTSVAQHAFVEKEQSDIALVQSAIQQVDREAKDLKARLAAARKSNDTDAEADVFLEMQALANNKHQLEQGLEALKDRALAARRQPVAPVAPRNDPVEAVASRLTPASAKWVREHPEFATDDAKRNKMVAAHYDATAEGLAADTPQYFEFIENRLGVTNDPEPRQTAQRQTSLRSPPPAAPARGNAPSRNPRTMQLSPLQREMARASGLTDEEYAANLAALRKEGKVSTN